jgi:hypothetical protein
MFGIRRWAMTGALVVLGAGCAGSQAPAAQQSAEPAAQATETQQASAGGAKPASKPAAAAPKAKETGASESADSEESFFQFDAPLRECRIAADYNECIAERVEPDTATEDELIMLIQSSRMIGQQKKARKAMRVYIDRFPDSPQADNYRDYLR